MNTVSFVPVAGRGVGFARFQLFVGGTHWPRPKPLPRVEMEQVMLTAKGAPRCVGRKCGSPMKEEGRAARYKAVQCDKACEAGSNLCRLCMKHEGEGKLHGRIGGPIAEWSHIAGSAWNATTRAKEDKKLGLVAKTAVVAAEAAEDAADAAAGAVEVVAAAMGGAGAAAEVRVVKKAATKAKTAAKEAKAAAKEATPSPNAAMAGMTGMFERAERAAAKEHAVVAKAHRERVKADAEVDNEILKALKELAREDARKVAAAAKAAAKAATAAAAAEGAVASARRTVRKARASRGSNSGPSRYELLAATRRMLGRNSRGRFSGPRAPPASRRRSTNRNRRTSSRNNSRRLSRPRIVSRTPSSQRIYRPASSAAGAGAYVPRLASASSGRMSNMNANRMMANMGFGSSPAAAAAPAPASSSSNASANSYIARMMANAGMESPAASAAGSKSSSNSSVNLTLM